MATIPSAVEWVKRMTDSSAIEETHQLVMLGLVPGAGMSPTYIHHTQAKQSLTEYIISITCM